MPTTMTSEESVTVVMNNKSPPTLKRTPPSNSSRKVSPLTPAGQQQHKSRSTSTSIDTPPRTTVEPTIPTAIVYHSPESIKLELPGSRTSTPPSKTLQESSEKLWKTVRGSPTTTTTTKSKRQQNGCRGKENNNWADRWMDQVQFRCGVDSSPCSAIRLTRDILQKHESFARRSPDRGPNFSGDKLAKTVIRRKTQLQLAREQREKAQLELLKLEAVPIDTTIPTSTPPPSRTDDITTLRWLEMERQKALAAKWQRKKNEQRESLRAEQLRQAELERQRKLQASPSTPIVTVKKMHQAPGEITPKTHHSARKLIHI